ncbi:MAG: hypothetical protein GXP63_04660 [DPANN group archaeon]|nr:hypothetical protein [DPANN group archaeon]
MPKNLVVISDVHVARIWNKIAKVLPKEIGFLNPNGQLQKMMRILTEDDALIINGDLVDYHYADYGPSAKKNLDYADDILSRFDGLTYINVGNHDFRSFAYNFSFYGLHHVNISRATRLRFRKRFGFHRFRWFDELRSINLFLKKDDKVSSQFLQKDYAVTLDRRRLLFLSTGPDAFSRPEIFFNPKYWPIIRHVLSTPSYGLQDKQLAYLRKELQDSRERQIVLFLHCPPFFSRDPHASMVLQKGKIFRRLAYSSFSSGMFARNVEPFLEILMASKKNILVISSHLHVPGQFIIDKETRRLDAVPLHEINQQRHDATKIKFVTTLPLGVIDRFNRKTGYLKIADNRIGHVVLREFS